MDQISYSILRVAINSLIEIDNTIYSASMVLRVIIVCNSDVHNKGHPINIITNPISDLTETDSWSFLTPYRPAKSASTQQSPSSFSVGFIPITLSLVPAKYMRILFISNA